MEVLRIVKKNRGGKNNFFYIVVGCISLIV